MRNVHSLRDERRGALNILEPEEISEEQSAELLDDLLALRQQLLGSLSEQGRSEVVELDLPIGRISRVDALQQQAMAEAEKRRAKERLKAVEAALEFHQEGDYGFCKACGEPLSFARLKARPESPLCVLCLQERGG